MATAAIVANQMGRPQGEPGKNRSDLSPGISVMLSNHDNAGAESWTWTLATPPGSKAVLRGATAPVASFIPDATGSYEIRLTVGGPEGQVSDRRVAAVGTPFLGLRKPLAQGGEPWEAIFEAFDRIDGDAARSLKTDGSNTPQANIGWGGHSIVNLGGLELEGVLRLGKAKDPEAMAGKGFLYLRDIGHSTDLFYCGADGALVRLTKDGRLNVPAAFDDRIRLQEDDAEPGYLAAKLAVAPGLSKTIERNTICFAPVFGAEPDTVCRGDDPRLSDARRPLEHSHDFAVGVPEPAPNAVPMANRSGKLDEWVSEATGETRGIIRLCGDLSGASGKPVVVGLRGVPFPKGAGFPRWREDDSGIDMVPYGTSAGTICQGDDARLSDPRVPVGKAEGQLSGSFPAPNVVGLTDKSGTGLKIGDVPDGCVLVRRDGEIVGADLSGRRTIAMALNEQTSSKVNELVGCFFLDGGEDVAPVSFLAISRVTRQGLVGSVKLRNATDSTMVAELKVDETAFASKRACGIRLPVGKKLYEVHISLAHGHQAKDALVCMWAGIITDQHM